RIAGRMLTRRTGPVAEITGADFPVVGARGIGGREGVGRASGARPGALLGDVALAGTPAADRRARGARGDRGRRAGAAAHLGRVARARGRAADRAGRGEQVGRTGHAHAVAGLRCVAGSGGRAADGTARLQLAARRAAVVVRRVAVVAGLAGVHHAV